MDIKYLVVDVDGEAVLKFVIPSSADGSNFEMLNAVIASNPTLRLVDSAQIGGIWDGTRYVS